MSNRWLFLIVAVLVVVMAMALAFRKAYHEVPKRIVVDMETQRQVDEYLKHDKPMRFVGVQEFKIILMVTERGEL